MHTLLPVPRAMHPTMVSWLIRKSVEREYESSRLGFVSAGGGEGGVHRPCPSPGACQPSTLFCKRDITNLRDLILNTESATDVAAGASAGR